MRVANVAQQCFINFCWFRAYDELGLNTPLAMLKRGRNCRQVFDDTGRFYVEQTSKTFLQN